MEGHFEIVSLLGTPSNLQISLSDKDGHVTTGHVTGDLIVFTTAEIVLGRRM
jgi:predicted DNA-binding protein with PD1-like motif